MTRCVYYRAYFHYARVKLSTCAFSRREIVCASGLLSRHCFVYRSVAVCRCSTLAVWQLRFFQSRLPQDPSGLGGTEFTQWAWLCQGGSQSFWQACSCANRLGDRVNLMVDWVYMYIYTLTVRLVSLRVEFSIWHRKFEACFVWAHEWASSCFVVVWKEQLCRSIFSVVRWVGSQLRAVAWVGHKWAFFY